MTRSDLQVQPAPAVAGASAYRVPRPPTPLDLFLDGNEGAVPPSELPQTLTPLMPDVVRRYPQRREFTEALARWLGIDTDQLLVTAGGDDALDRICRTMLCAGREFVLPEPTFEMLPRYNRLAGGTIVSIPWADGPYPIDDVLAAITDKTALVAVVSPNNPTGCVASAEDLRRVSAAAPQALILADLAYSEFADEDLTPVVLELPNAIAVRTFSKAWGLAGLRVGYAISRPEIINWLRAAGNPYSVSGPSLALALQRLRDGQQEMQAFVAGIRRERTALSEQLKRLGARVAPSQGNFLFARFDNAEWVRDGLAGMGISVRHFADRPTLTDGLRITCPGQPEAFDRLSQSLEVILQPEGLLFDMDGVLADAGDAYAESIEIVLGKFGHKLSREQVVAAQQANPGLDRLGVAVKLLEDLGAPRSFDEVFAAFGEIYFDDGGPLGWNGPKPVLVAPAWLAKLKQRRPIAICTSRFRGEAERFMKFSGFDQVVDVVICADDCPPKPDPAPLRLAMERLGVRRAWMMGDSGSDMLAARAAGALPIGIITPGADAEQATAKLLSAGAGRVLTEVAQIEELLP